MRTFDYHTPSGPTKKSNRFTQPFKRFWKNLNKKKVTTWLFRAIAIGVVLVAFLFLYYSKDLPNPGKLIDRNVPESTKILSRDGQLLYEVHGEFKRTQVTLNDISDDAEHATVAIEDKNFFNHRGISLTGILRSVFVDIVKGEKAQGGSTITQQFVKNAILSKDKAFTRKIKEIILAIELEARFSKAEILNFYLNEIPYGRNAYGIEAASEAFFNKHAKDLTLAESAYLSALPQAPTFYNPLGPNRDALDARQKRVLTAMKEQGYINQEQFDQAANEKVTFSPLRNAIKAPHFVLYVQDQLAKKYGEKTVEEGGLKVYTTLDLRLQEIAENAVKEGAEKNLKNSKSHNAALVAMDPKTGQILAMVGSKDYFGEQSPAGCISGKNCKFDPNVNIAVTPQQPGSSFKPYAYVTAFKKEKGFSPASVLFDVVTDFGGGYKPQNYSNNQRGPVSIRQALAGSLNIPAVKILALVGVEDVTQTARDLGITSPMSDCGLSLVLGGCDVKLLDHVNGYASLATLGERHDKTSILKIEDRSGKILEEFEDKSERVLDPEAAYQVVDIMKDNGARTYVFGPNSSLTIPGREVAAKSGTANKWLDQWTLGFTPSLVAGVWSGNNDNSEPVQGSVSDGSQTAAPIWNKFMREALKDSPKEEFKHPDGMQRIAIDTLSGKLPTELSKDVHSELFASYNAPKERDNVHVAVKIDILTGQPATESTPPEQTTVKVFTNIHSEKPGNPNWEDPVIRWVLGSGTYELPPNGSIYVHDLPDGGTDPNAGVTISITDPQSNTTINKSPFTVSVSASYPAQISKMELVIDGTTKQSTSQQPYTFTVNEKLGDGSHTIAIRATTKDGKIVNTSIPINYSSNQSQTLTLTSPSSGNLNFPVTLTAQSNVLFDAVGFYYQSGNSAKLIGSTQGVSGGGVYTYTLDWEDQPKSGIYKLFARSDTGLNSQKISVIVQ
jgi:1A family penicillin-binding protein